MTKITMKNIQEQIERLNIEVVELQYLDPMGDVHSMMINPFKLTKNASGEFLGDKKGKFLTDPNDLEGTLDGSSVKGFQNIDKTGLIIIPGPDPRIYVDPTNSKCLVIMGNTQDPNENKLYAKDPRNQAIIAEKWLKEQRLGLRSMRVGPEFEFFIFPKALDLHTLDATNTVYHCSAAENPYSEFMTKYMLALQAAGVDTRFYHAEVASHQQEIGVNCETLLRAADNVIIQRQILKKLANQHGLQVSWEPKLLDAYSKTIKQIGCEKAINGSGLHTNISFDLEDGGKNAFIAYDKQDKAITNELSDIAKLAIAGILKHAKSLQAFYNRTTNSGFRLAKEGETPVFIGAGWDNRSAMLRLVTVRMGEEFKTRIEVRAPDSMTCPHTWFAALQMAIVEAIQLGKDMPHEQRAAADLVPKIIDQNFYDMTEEERLAHKIEKLHIGPTIVDDALNSLLEDHDYLLDANGPFGATYEPVLGAYAQTVKSTDVYAELVRATENAKWIKAQSETPTAIGLAHVAELQRANDLKEKELALRERELALHERELAIAGARRSNLPRTSQNRDSFYGNPVKHTTISLTMDLSDSDVEPSDNKKTSECGFYK